jgi:hypothetical protein
MTTIDDLLAQSQLLLRPHVPSDCVPYDDLAYAGFPDEHLTPWNYGAGPADEGAAQNLTALCEAVVAHCAAAEFADFLTDQVPQPRTAWILGCVLQLAGAAAGARFWWQYAAGDDDVPASYCLYLQHLADGDAHAAAVWHTQAERRTHAEPPAQCTTADPSLATVLRVLTRLSHKRPRPHTPTAQAVIKFVSAAVAVGYDQHPDLEIPVPGENFAEQLERVASGTHRRTTPSAVTTEAPTKALPARSSLDTTAESAPAHERQSGPDRLLVEVEVVTSEDHAPRGLDEAARGLFEDAVAVCWERATAADSDDERGSRMTYYLNRFRTRALALSPGGSRAPYGFSCRPPLRFSPMAPPGRPATFIAGM